MITVERGVLDEGATAELEDFEDAMDVLMSGERVKSIRISRDFFSGADRGICQMLTALTKTAS
jgi:hypothetical protein